MKRLFFLFVTAALFGCSKKEDKVTEAVGPTYNATVVVHLVHYQFANGVQTSTPAQNATVKFYETKQEALNGTNPKFSKTTNDNGSATFNQLQKPKYYVYFVHAAFGQKLDSVDTPNNSYYTWEETL